MTEGVFVGSGIFKSEDPAKRAEAIVRATINYLDAKIVAEVPRGLRGARAGTDIRPLGDENLIQFRGW